jgi:hypothetical protein
MEPSARIEAAFSQAKGNYAITSEQTPIYNCIAWAAGVDTVWWDPAPGYVWPVGALREYSVAALISVYKVLGFEICQGGEVEQGWDKIAVYGDNHRWTHAARQLPSGKWTSKLGELEDIEHATPHCLAKGEYGNVICLMKRIKT